MALTWQVMLTIVMLLDGLWNARVAATPEMPAQWEPTKDNLIAAAKALEGSRDGMNWQAGVREEDTATLDTRMHEPGRGALSPSQFRAEPPPPLNSAEYARDYNEVKALGSLENSARTPAQTQLAYFYADNFFAQWHRVIRSFAEMHIGNDSDRARLLAQAWLAAADAFITTWDSKIYYCFWRPMTAINEGDSDGNQKTAGDPNWKPFLNNPNYPEYSSARERRGLPHLQALFRH